MKRLRCDVAIVGCGVAGLSAALSALEAGASVIVLERAPEHDRGGNTRWTGALLRVTDTGEPWEDFRQGYLLGAGYHPLPEFVRSSGGAYETWPSLVKALPFVDRELLDAFVAGVPAGLQWLRELGVPLGHDTFPFVPPIPPLVGVKGGGKMIVETLCPLVTKQGGTILYETTAYRLLQDEDNRVIGVAGADAKNESVIVAAKSVVLASGGFEGNPTMMAQYIGPNSRYMRPVARGGWYNKGEGIRMALDIGAAPAGDYADCHRESVDPRSDRAEALVSAFPLGIVVNRKGERFFDEASGDFSFIQEGPSVAINSQPGGIGYFIYDSRIDEAGNWRAAIWSDQPPIEAATVAELAAKIGVPAEDLEQTIRDFNTGCSDDPVDMTTFDGHATRGVMPKKSNFARRIARPPFGCYPMISAVVFTYGALRVTKDAQVVNTSGAVIPGLYAAGETVGIVYGTYVAATSVLRGLVFGRRAGTHAGKGTSLLG
jgi:tricarballylate dehydrogenase